MNQKGPALSETTDKPIRVKIRPESVCRAQKLPREEALQLARIILQAYEPGQPREYLVGFSPETLAFHRIEAVSQSSTHPTHA